MMRAGVVAVLLSFGAVFALAACGGTKVPTHPGYKSVKAKPWEKPKVLKLEKNAAKAETDLDYARYKRAKWFAVDLPGPGSLAVQIEVTPGGPGSGGGGEEDEEGEELDMDVGLEIVDGTSFNVLAKSDLEADDAHELKKQRMLRELPEGRYLIHVYLQGRLDTADVELKIEFARGELAWQSDFPNQVAFADTLPAVPPLDDTPEAEKPRPRPSGPRPPRGPGTPPPPPPPTGGTIMAEISDVQPEGSGTKITIAGGTSDGLENGLSGSIKGVRNSSFKLSGCGPSTCRATVKAPPDDVRGAAGVMIKLKAAP
jgi:hypothetical protein